MPGERSIPSTFLVSQVLGQAERVVPRPASQIDCLASWTVWTCAVNDLKPGRVGYGKLRGHDAIVLEDILSRVRRLTGFRSAIKLLSPELLGNDHGQHLKGGNHG